jgi:response regulator RpfG family c-di-GMP phosphodiesterase
LVAAVATHAADAMVAALRIERLGQSYRDLARLVAKASDARQPQRADHAQSVGYYAGLIAQELGLSLIERERIEFAGLLHDIGKACVPDAILQKQEKLTEEELELVRSATISGAEWLSEVEGLREVASMVRHQNERWDGSGLPDGLTGEAIPLGARVLAVALRFAAMTQPRADRGPRPVVGGALDALAAEAGTALDPHVVQSFLAALGRSL